VLRILLFFNVGIPPAGSLAHHDKASSTPPGPPTHSFKKPNKLPCHVGEVEGLRRKKRFAIYRIPLYTLTLQARVKPVPVHIPTLIVIRYFGSHINPSNITSLKPLRFFFSRCLASCYPNHSHKSSWTTNRNLTFQTKTLPKIKNTSIKMMMTSMRLASHIMSCRVFEKLFIETESQQKLSGFVPFHDMNLLLYNIS